MRILFIHHGDHRAGSFLSMLYTILEIKKKGYTPIVGLVIPSDELNAILSKYQIEFVDMPWIYPLHYWSCDRMEFWRITTYYIIFKAIYRNITTSQKTKSSLENLNIQMVHLNSVVLFPLLPLFFKLKIKYVWHIREHAPSRFHYLFPIIRKLMLKSENLIFLTETEKTSWLSGINHGIVVNNFVDQTFIDHQFDFKAETIKESLEIDTEKKVILYLGGLKKHKGIDILLDTLHQLRHKYDNFICLMPDAVPSPKKQMNFKELLKKIIGIKRFDMLMVKKINSLGLNDICYRLPWDSDTIKYYTIADLVVFPATAPHFARPVIEAAIMKKPVVVANWKVLLEEVKPNITGLVAKPNSVKSLYTNIELLLTNDILKKKLGNNAYNYAIEIFTPERQVHKIVALYEKKTLLNCVAKTKVINNYNLVFSYNTPRKIGN
jgi:glycosyltransferase involved in cell wall biosynthesis